MTVRTDVRVLACACGQTTMEVEGDPIISVVCACTSCRTAGRLFEDLGSSASVLRADGGTDDCLDRKDRLRITNGAHLEEHRLAPDAKTRRVVAGCCHTPMCLDFTQGHWVTVYRDRLAHPRPGLELRTMAADIPRGTRLDDDIPTHASQSFVFFRRLIGARAATGFRRPAFRW